MLESVTAKYWLVDYYHISYRDRHTHMKTAFYKQIAKLCRTPWTGTIPMCGDNRWWFSPSPPPRPHPTSSSSSPSWLQSHQCPGCNKPQISYTWRQAASAPILRLVFSYIWTVTWSSFWLRLRVWQVPSYLDNMPRMDKKLEACGCTRSPSLVSTIDRQQEIVVKKPKHKSEFKLQV